MPVPYEAPIAEMGFLLNHVTGLSRFENLPELSECTPDVVDAVLREAARFAQDIISPLNEASEKQAPVLSEGQVTTSPGYRNAYQQFIASGWNGLASPAVHGGQGLAQVISTAVSEMWQSASMSFGLCPMLTAGAINAIEHHASKPLQQMFLANLVSGRWTGTMNLTEPQAGSDLAAITTRAIPAGDHYLIKGTKIFITYGEHDLAENIVHLVLAKLPDAPAGVKGISLFIVPKFLVNPDGTLGDRNDLICGSLEHKIGIHGSPTAVMRYGDHAGAVGYLVGEPHNGLAYMFTMMNHARLQVGLQGVAVSQRSLQQAMMYAQDRVQGRTLLQSADPAALKTATPIAGHPDVLRMLLSMQARVQAMRALTLEAATEMDLASQSNPDAARASQARVDLLIPIVKGWCTELSIDVTSLGVQVHGGMGYIEETGAGQLWRDARITSIYEGTTAIQANDLVGRKLLRDNGQAMKDLLRDAHQTSALLEASPDARLQRLGQQIAQGVQTLQTSVDWCLAQPREDAASVYFGSVPLLMLSGFVLGGWMMGRCALACTQTPVPDKAPVDPDLAGQQIRLALVYGDLVLVPALGLAHAITSARHVLSA